MSDTNRPQLSTSKGMLSRLPYTLTKGVTATREGLVVDNDASESVVHVTLQWLGRDRLSGYAGRIFDWPDAAERLRYREGEPSCIIPFDPWEPECWVNISASESQRNLFQPLDLRLHRLAAILCDDADAFRVLHWCVEEFGNPSTTGGMG